ncbi:hypothetical protein I203_107720 [Kwoniella mangroviensis CBS 8507]|uniref:hypothetical protein n=1 Tax=Kwoniella mangroviensis CBS 8507 TaxID=1296122 RepID=UPI00080D6797|nr:uncharacterized protein I203_02469 [Kwoniella mangroviensis CBS 8507]OCF69073.1 hypothetical protein I203_02469 [Kwoniella mangroviensis CBS 8507]
MSVTNDTATDEVSLTDPLFDMTLESTSEILTSVPSASPEQPKSGAISISIEPEGTTVTVADTIPSTIDENKTKAIFMGTTHLFRGMKKVDERPGIEWLARLTWDEKHEPSQDVKDSATKFDYGYLVPQLRKLPGTSMREKGETAFHAAWEAFKSTHPDESEKFEIKYVSQEEYANAHPYPSSEHPFSRYGWEHKGTFDFDKHTEEVDEFYADGSEKSKGIVLIAVFLKRGAYIDRKVVSSADKEDTGASGDSNAPVTEDVMVMPESEAAIRLASLPGFTISQENEEKSLQFIAQMKEKLTSVTKDQSGIVVNDSLAPKDRVYAITANNVNSTAERSGETVQSAFHQDTNRDNHFAYLHLSPDDYEAFGNPVKISRVSYEEYWDWAKKSNGYGNDGPEGTGKEVSVI